MYVYFDNGEVQQRDVTIAAPPRPSINFERQIGKVNPVTLPDEEEKIDSRLMTAKRRNEQGVDDGEKIDSHLVTAKKWNQQGVVHEVEQLDGSD